MPCISLALEQLLSNRPGSESESEREKHLVRVSEISFSHRLRKNFWREKIITIAMSTVVKVRGGSGGSAPPHSHLSPPAIV